MSEVSLVDATAPSQPAVAAARRRTFAIISHPDAGKTTLTEKLLLQGGAIHLAGEVKAKGERRRARSDWMKIEQQRGISVSTSVMTFDFAGCTFNLLDTPGHEDFSEDTYRTLTAVDSAVMVLDAAKGIETQTRKLFEVCRLRDMPIVTFVNKFDREARDPLELLDEIQDQLALDTAPMMWPVGMGQNFKGCWLFDEQALLHVDHPTERYRLQASPLPDPDALAELAGREQAAHAVEGMDLVHQACPPFDAQAFREGHLTPVFFGSALRNFGVAQLLEGLARMAPSPQPQPSRDRVVEPGEDKVSGFVFKVQANMDPKHRDRVAFLRLCSGRFQRGMKLKQVRSGKPITVSAPIFFFADDRGLADQAWPGDIIGVPNHGVLRVGDSLTEGEDLRFTGIPNFAPEILQRVRLDDPMKQKHLRRALEDLAEEGVTQVFKPMLGAQWVVGVVGRLQLDVLQTRIENEYGIKIGFDSAPYVTARWVDGEKDELERFVRAKHAVLAEDRDGHPVFLARNAFDLQRTVDEWPKLAFTAVRERA
ncbi:MAG: peptide chain release factor 3 [Pseudomonadota bacterium]